MDLFKWVGRVLVALSFIFIFFLLWQVDWSEIAKHAKLSWIFTFAIATAIYIYAIYLLSYNWNAIVQKISDKTFSKDVMYVYLETVVYKYIPGNIFHFAGRHKLEKSLSISRKTIIYANSMEILFQLFSAVLLSLFMYIFIDEKLLTSYKEYLQIFIYLSIALFFFAVLSFYKKHGLKVEIKNKALFLAKILINYILFLVLSGAVLALILNLFYDASKIYELFFIVIFINTVAWLAGYITPGSPGGIGVRETIILMPLLSLNLDKDVVLLSVILQRVVMIFSELLLYLFAKIQLNRSHK
ncbi:MAG: lysylphosphatidylglycerol synthase domain-containing protein [Sulfurimonas sp.]|nr:lysylphosphatidylglycerol synthase domain-containing protein [Sulfurimonas sp.]